MPATTADCKKLLEQDPRLDGLGGWKRLSKATALDGIERIFTDKTKAQFVRVLENGNDLSITAIENSLEEVVGIRKFAKVPLVPFKVEDLYPIDMGMPLEKVKNYLRSFAPGYDRAMHPRAAFREQFTTFEFDFEGSEPEYGTLYFYFEYMEKDGSMYDQGSVAAIELLTTLFADCPEKMDLSAAEGYHGIEVEGDEEDEDYEEEVDKVRDFLSGRIAEIGESTLPADHRLFSPRSADLESMVDATAIGGKELFCLDWHELSEDDRRAFQIWAVSNGFRLAFMNAPVERQFNAVNADPDLSIHDRFAIAEHGKLLGTAEVKARLKGAPPLPLLDMEDFKKRSLRPAAPEKERTHVRFREDSFVYVRLLSQAFQRAAAFSPQMKALADGLLVEQGKGFVGLDLGIVPSEIEIEVDNACNEMASRFGGWVSWGPAAEGAAPPKTLVERHQVRDAWVDKLLDGSIAPDEKAQLGGEAWVAIAGLDPDAYAQINGRPEVAALLDLDFTGTNLGAVASGMLQVEMIFNRSSLVERALAFPPEAKQVLVSQLDPQGRRSLGLSGRGPGI